ncbi:hypothetical protein ACMXYR_09425 [Neptuniibacter sp. QD29_5]
MRTRDEEHISQADMVVDLGGNMTLI